MSELKLTSSKYFHRDLSWLLFNRRVIMEAQDPDNPLLEQLRFLAIGSNNSDEFFMIRVPGIQSLARLDNQIDSKTGWNHDQVLKRLFELNDENNKIQYSRYRALTQELQTNDYFFKKYAELDEAEQVLADTYFQQMVLPAVTPIGLDAYHAFPKIAEKTIHIFVHVSNGERHEKSIIPLPPLFDRLYQLEGTQTFILLEDLIVNHLEKIFVGWQIHHHFFFRITYDKDLEFEEDSEENLFVQMEEYIEERSKGLPSRLELAGDKDPLALEDIAYLSQMLELKPRDLYWINGPLDLTFLFQFIKKVSPEHPDWLYTPFKAYLDPNLRGNALYRTIEKQDVLLQHPYESFESVLSFLENAAEDPNTVAIKQTLYRMADNSRVIAALKKAAESGKQVTVLVELKARFDEENNLHWVQELEEAGCYVSYGLHQLKTHSKAVLVIKKSGNTLKRYVHIGTGNYNENTATLYTDLCFFTSQKEYVEDITAFFNYLSGYRELPNYQRLAVSPVGIRAMILKKIEEQIQHHKETQQGRIIFKVNALTDLVIVDKLYEASQAGVPIDLIVRGACCLRPGIKGLSETIQVRSIVGRFLEHSRIYSFGEKGETKIWLSSADSMTRNMMLRVEIAAPLTQQQNLKKAEHILDVFLEDTKKTYYLTEDGTYHRHTQSERVSAQKTFVEEANAHKQHEIEAPRDSFIQRLRKIWQNDLSES